MKITGRNVDLVKADVGELWYNVRHGEVLQHRGAVQSAKHYMLPPTERLPDVMRLVEREQYFAIHAARQSGKTTLLKALASVRKQYKIGQT